MSSHEHASDTQRALTSTGEEPTRGLATELGALARALRTDPSMSALLRRITDAAVLEVEGADWAGISLIAGSRVTSEAATDPIAARSDALQTELGQGPCLDALRDQHTVRSDDLGTDERWPEFAARAVSMGLGSMLSVQLFVENDNLGALNMYAGRTHAFDEGDESTAILLAAHAAVAMKHARVESNLLTALASRDIIGQAKGILMERYKITAAEAFDLLTQASKTTHRKLRDLADELATSGQLQTGLTRETGYSDLI